MASFYPTQFIQILTDHTSVCVSVHVCERDGVCASHDFSEHSGSGAWRQYLWYSRLKLNTDEKLTPSRYTQHCSQFMCLKWSIPKYIGSTVIQNVCIEQNTVKYNTIIDYNILLYIFYLHCNYYNLWKCLLHSYFFVFYLSSAWLQSEEEIAMLLLV